MSNQIYSIDELSKKIGKVLSGFPIKKAILFGSYAKGEANEISDIDLVINMSGEIDGFQFLEILGHLNENLNKDIDLIEQSEIIKGGKIDKEITNTGIVIYGK